MTSVLSLSKAVGGYFELELPRGYGIYHTGALKYQSARSAFLALLQHRKPKRVWMPYFICDTMLAPVEMMGADVIFYSINSNFTIASDVSLNKDDLLLYVNYFGLCSEYQDELLSKFNPEQVVFDHSQAFFCRPKNCLATIYSPRKFFGIPDGGLLITGLAMNEPEDIDEGSIDRCLHLLKRLGGEPEDGYASYQKAEESLKKIKPEKMSFLTERLLNSINYESIKSKREENFAELHCKLSMFNRINSPLTNIQGPMVYPFVPTLSGKEIKSDLIKQRCFVSTYWPECKTRLSSYDVEKNLVDNLIPLPCDQRVLNTDFLSLIINE